MNRKSTAKNLTASAVCLALCMVLPLLTGQIPQIGMALSPMHIPVLLCGYLTGPAYATIIGLVAPLMRTILFASPPPFMAIPMCFELAAYGLLAGALYRAFPKRIVYIYVALILSMLIGRFVWGLAAWQLVASGIIGVPDFMSPFTWDVFFTMAFYDAIPGIILHIVLIPPLVLVLRKAGFRETLK